MAIALNVVPVFGIERSVSERGQKICRLTDCLQHLPGFWEISTRFQHENTRSILPSFKLCSRANAIKAKNSDVSNSFCRDCTG